MQSHHCCVMSKADLMRADLMIVGGGLAGLALAFAAGSAGLRVVLIERESAAEATKADYDGRVTSLSYGSKQMFETLGLWRHLAGVAEAILDIRVSDGASPLFLHFDHRDVGERPFGYMVENRFIRRALLRAVVSCQHVSFLNPVSVTALHRDQGSATAELDNGAAVRAHLAVAADGRSSKTREAAGIRVLSWRYRQTAIVTTIRHSLAHHGVAKEHFLPAGPFALLPMRDNRSSVVWTEQDDAAVEMMALPEPEFTAEIAARAGGHLGDIEVDGPRWSHPLGLVNAERYVAERLALVGDAAHAMHPIAGQGFNLGLRDVAYLAELLVEAARLGLDIGDAGLLKRYQERRHWDAFTMLLMTDGLNRLFSNDAAPLRIARDLGLGVVNRIGPAKRFFERRASAMTGDLPRLMRGQPI